MQLKQKCLSCATEELVTACTLICITLCIAYMYQQMMYLYQSSDDPI